MVLPDANLIKEIELDPWDLLMFDSVRTLREFASTDVTLVWTPLAGMNVSILNILSPRGQIFWSLADYEAFRRGRSRVCQQLSDSAGLSDRLLSLLTEVGETNSFYSHVLLGGVTRGYGERFAPASLDKDYFLLAQRHDSIALPNSCRSAISRYFRRMVDVFSTESVRDCDEGLSLAGDKHDGTFQSQLSGELLAKPVEIMTAEQLAKLTVQIAEIGMTYQNWRAGNEFELSYGCRGGISIALMRPAVGAATINDVAAIMTFRVNVGLRHCSLRVVEGLKKELCTPGWNLLALADLREELLGLLDAKLSQYPVIQTDPFSCVL